MNYEMKHTGTLIVAVACTILTGCTSTKRTVQPPKAPDPIKLVALPDYGPEKTGYDTSAGCVVVGDLTGQNLPVIITTTHAISEGLTKRGYPVVQVENISTAEDRGKIEKVIQFHYSNSRNIYLPTISQFATDYFLVVSVMDVPDVVLNTTELPSRTFSVIARDITEETNQLLRTSPRAIQNAVDNLFRLDSFCQALEGEKEKVATN